MNFKKNWKRFWTLSSAREGFTLVELIVVIAILAILAGVAVPAYSGYVTKANKQADITLAGEIEQALWLAHYSGKLTEGASVVVYYGEGTSFDVKCNDITAEAAMIAAFGENYAEVLRLKYDGWDKEIGLAGEAATIEIVRASNFTPDSLGSLLDQLQLVVDAAANYLSNGSLSDGNVTLSNQVVADMIGVENGSTLDATSGMAAANAYVYAVAGDLAGLDFSFGNDTSEEDAAKVMEFAACWNTFDFSAPAEGTDHWDPATRAAAKYASVYALATYIDKATAGTENATSYTAAMDAEGDPRNVANNVLAAIQANSAVQTEYNTYCKGDPNSEEAPASTTDMLSFLAYMRGVTESSDALLADTDLTNTKYFTDGYVANYVNNYMAMSDTLSANGINGSVIVIMYANGMVSCLPDIN